MHISDGVLPAAVSIGSFLASGALAAIGIKMTRPEDLPKVAVVTAAFFVAALVHVPLGPTSVHLLLPGLVGLLLGPAAFVSIGLGLTLQSLLFQFGGLTAIGANSLMMGLPALLAGLVFRLVRGKSLVSHVVAGALCGSLGTACAAILLAGLLATGGESFAGMAKLALAAHLPVFFIEGIISGFTVSFLYRVKPEMLGRQREHR